MQKWEYLFVTAEEEDGIFRPSRVNGRELPNWRHGTRISEYANQIGQEGWELVNVLSTSFLGDSRGFRYYFKRPIE